MNARLPLLIPLLMLAGLGAGCQTTASAPQVDYPASYDIQVGTTAATTDEAGPKSGRTATQQVQVVPHELLYYRVDSPVDVIVSVYENRNGDHVLLGQMRGTSFTTSVMPSTGNVEFSFAPSTVNRTGTVRFTLSDSPIVAVAAVE